MKTLTLGAVTTALAALAFSPASLAAQKVLNDDLSSLGNDDVAITPDGRYAVVRENTAFHTTNVYDLATGQLAASVAGTSGSQSGPSQDAVAVTNDRAVVIGSSVDILDLTNLANPLLARHGAGVYVRDVAITPDGTLAAVRGGQGIQGGLFLYDLVSGAQLSAHPGQPNDAFAPEYSFDVDGVVVNDRFAVMCSLVGTNLNPNCRVTFFQLHPAGGGPPVVAFETTAGGSDLLGAPYDLVMSPDGRRVAIRSELEIAIYDIRGNTPTVLVQAPPLNTTTPFYEEALDAVETTNERVVVLSRYVNQTVGTGTQIDVFNLESLQQGFVRVPGSPHDLAITPDETRAVVRTRNSVHLIDLSTGVGGPGLLLDSADAPGTATQYYAGLDSIVVTDDRAVTITRGPQGDHTHVRFWDITGGSLEQIGFHDLQDSQPVDVGLTPDGLRAVVVGTTKIAVYLVETGTALLDHAVIPPAAFWPWSDGVALNDERAVGVGYQLAAGGQAVAGWLSIVDIEPLGTPFCQTAPNSNGSGALIGAAGTESVSADDLRLWVRGAARSRMGRFFYGTTQTQTPFGDGTLCVGPVTFPLDEAITNTVGASDWAVDLANPPSPGGLITPGTTWHFQFVYRDQAFGPAGFNLSNGISVTFAP